MLFLGHLRLKQLYVTETDKIMADTLAHPGFVRYGRIKLFLLITRVRMFMTCHIFIQASIFILN
jgi:hypothetical protein